ncbi:MAG: phosphoribosylaminoimidazolesuccinocarboxamide synthase [Gammaproteobacteria bacterium]
MKALFESKIHSLPLIKQGKVRDIYAVDEHHMLIVTTDRLSAFDVVLPDPIPGKGELLTEISNFWFARMTDIIPNHLSELGLEDILTIPQEREAIKTRSVIVKKLKPLPVEAIVRGYLIGSGWKDYQRSGAICGIELPANLRQAEQLAEPIYTPSSKADVGDHDINIDFATTENLLGVELATRVREVSIEIYLRAAKHALERGIIIADTKFEFGLDEHNQLVLIDEVLTPDSSRFWPVADYKVGISPPSYDKQIIRDYLETLDWDKKPPGPKLPAEIIERTRLRYLEAVEKLTN